jgi:AraC-like DNA-binding protein
MKSALVQRQNWTLQISENTTDSIHIEILGKYTTPVLLEYNGHIREISVIFKPLGLNRFFEDNYLSLAPHFSQELENDVWRKFGETLFSGDDDISKIESFLLSQFCDNQEVSNIENSLTLLENSNDQISISDIAVKIGLNLKTFQRHFQKHMGCSPVEYRRICRFRSSLTNKLNTSQWKNLTDITYEEGYYDQSYLIKEFRKITNHNPKDFFKSASKVDGDKIIWEIK